MNREDLNTNNFGNMEPLPALIKGDIKALGLKHFEHLNGIAELAHIALIRDIFLKNLPAIHIPNRLAFQVLPSFNWFFKGGAIGHKL